MSIVTSAEHEAVLSYLPVLQLWHRLLMLSSWLSCDGRHTLPGGVALLYLDQFLSFLLVERYPNFGLTLTKRHLASEKTASELIGPVSAAILAIVQAESHANSGDDQGTDCGQVVATYLAFNGLCSVAGRCWPSCL
jgi:hypothetical protein